MTSPATTALSAPTHRTAAAATLLGLALAASSTVALAQGTPATAQGAAEASAPPGERPYLGRQFRVQPNADRQSHRRPATREARAMLVAWHDTAMAATGLDHTPLSQGEQRAFGEQIGPARASRAMAIVHIAMFEAVNALTGQPFESYVGLEPAAGRSAALDAAIAQAGHDTLVALFPSQRPRFDQHLAEDLSTLRLDPARQQAGQQLGARAATAILQRRANDGAQTDEPDYGTQFEPAPGVAKWRQDPVSRSPIALGAYWGRVKPFVLERGDQFRVPAPPAPESAEFAAAYNEAKALGGDGTTTPTTRTGDQTYAGIFWAYDGTPTLCAPPRLYNQITMQLAQQRGMNVVELARSLALLNTTLADAAIASWESKFFWQVGRPVTVIREGIPNASTQRDERFTPLGAMASNLTGPNFTPPFPAYPSGHATFGGATFQALRHMLGTDQVAFTFTSDELNGKTLDHDGTVRPLMQRQFTSLSQAEEENGQSRIYLGIHWSFDKTAGIAQGRQVADYVAAHAFRPRERQSGPRAG